MVLAHMASIPIFATGGIGGVHRGAESTMDISADLTELGRTPVAVFCSGPKSILDIPRTLEVLVGLRPGQAQGSSPVPWTVHCQVSDKACLPVTEPKVNIATSAAD